MAFPGRLSAAFRSAPIALALVFCSEPAAHAETRERSADEIAQADRQQAEDLYKEGTLLLANGRYLEAEVRFQASFKLLRGRGTLLNLAICHENLGRPASAWRELKSLEEQAAVAGDTLRLEAAREHLAWVEPQLSYLNVSLSSESQSPEVLVELDGEPLSTFDVLFPVDPGRHQLRASAPGKKAWSVELTFQTGNPPQRVTIPNLADADAVPAIPQLAPQGPPKAAVPLVQRPPEPLPPPDYSGVYIAGAATLTLTVGAVASAFAYYDRRAAYHEAITKPEPRNEAEQSALRESAERMAWINGSLIVGAGVGAAVTGVLWYRAARSNTARVARGTWVAPLVGGSGAGLQVGGSF